MSKWVSQHQPFRDARFAPFVQIVAGSASASTDTGLCDFRPSTPTPPVQLPSSTPPGFPTAGAFIVAPGETKPITPGCRQPDAGNRSDARAHSKSHVAAGERPAASSGGGNFGGTGASVPATGKVVFDQLCVTSLAVDLSFFGKPYRGYQWWPMFVYRALYSK